MELQDSIENKSTLGQLEKYAAPIAFTIGVLGLFDVLHNQINHFHNLFGAIDYKLTQSIGNVIQSIMNVLGVLILFIIVDKMKQHWQLSTVYWIAGYIAVVCLCIFIIVSLYGFFGSLNEVDLWIDYSKYLFVFFNILHMVYYLGILISPKVHFLYKRAFGFRLGAVIVWTATSFFPFIGYEWYLDVDHRAFWLSIFLIAGVIGASTNFLLYQAFKAEQLKEEFELV